jgi:acetyl-CoA acyltransferase 1
MVAAGERLSSVMGHLNPYKAAGRSRLLEKNKDDIVRRHREYSDPS